MSKAKKDEARLIEQARKEADQGVQMDLYEDSLAKNQHRLAGLRRQDMELEQQQRDIASKLRDVHAQMISVAATISGLKQRISRLGGSSPAAQ